MFFFLTINYGIKHDIMVSFNINSNIQIIIINSIINKTKYLLMYSSNRANLT